MRSSSSSNRVFVNAYSLIGFSQAAWSDDYMDCQVRLLNPVNVFRQMLWSVLKESATNALMRIQHMHETPKME